MRYDHFSMLPEKAFQPRNGRFGMTLEGGSSGGGGSPQPSSTSQTTIPEYAKPYMERLLGKSEAASEAPYQTYGGERLTGPTPEQQAARSGVAGLQTPGQFGAGSQLAGVSGLGALGFGGQGSLAGQNYFGLATSPAAQQAFMSPYMQNVVDVQKQEAIRDAQKGQLAQNLAAARQGTYGGARQTLAMTERERNLGQQLAQIQATGGQRAFEAAQQAQQFGSELGLKGLGLGIQGAQAATQAGAALGQLGIAQQQSDLDRLRAQEAAGALTQQEQQAKLDLAYQDFLAQQRYPYTQLGFMSDILRGSGNLAGTGGRAIYEAPPSTGSQLLGLAANLGGAYLAGGRKFAEGGEVKGLGAVKRYAEGGSVIDDMVDVDKLTPEQIKDTRSTGARKDVPDYVLLGELQAKLNEIEQAKAQGIPDTTVAEDIRAQAMQEISGGIDSIPIADNYYRSDEEVAQLAGGGIIAFANEGFVDPMFTSGFTEEGLTPLPERTSPTENMTLQELQEYYRKKQKDETTGLPQVLDEAKKAPPKVEPKKEAPKPAPKKEEGAGVSDKDQKKVAKAEDGYEKALRAELDKTNMSEDDKLQALGFALMKAGSKAMAGKSRYAMQNIGEGIEAGVDEYVKTLNQSKKDKRQLTKDLAEYGLAKERLRIAERGVEETAATRRETAAQTAAMRMQANITKAREEYNSMYGMVPRFLDKEGTKVNPKWKSFSEYLREQGIDLGGGPAPAAASGERPPISSFRG